MQLQGGSIDVANVGPFLIGDSNFYAGRRSGSQQASPRAYPGVQKAPSFDVALRFSTPLQWFACARLLEPHLTQSLPCLFLNAHHPGF